MNRKRMLDLIRDISNADGVSGFEDDVLTVLRDYGRDLGTFSEDSLRNLYLDFQWNKGSRPVIQIDAHMDEVGFMVQSVNPDGTMHFTNLGGWVPCNIPAHKVRVRNREGKDIIGVVASKPPHFMSEEERNKAVAISDMVIDVGASSLEEVVQELKIGIGAPVVPDVDFTFDEERGLMLGKAFDCRLGCAAAVAMLDELKNEDLQVDIKAGFSVQEEVGIRGSVVTARQIKPDVAIVFEGCPADDTFLPPHRAQTVMNKGPMLRHIDARMITNPRFLRFALNLAQEQQIPVQEAVRTGGATNGGSIHLANQGVPVIVIGLPVRYIHTHYGYAKLVDFENSVKLGAAVVKALNKENIAGF